MVFVLSKMHNMGKSKGLTLQIQSLSQLFKCSSTFYLLQLWEQDKERDLRKIMTHFHLFVGI